MPRGGERFGAWYDHATAEKAVAFFPRHLRLTEGEWAGRPFVLAPWQAQIVRQVFGWKRADGSRLIRTLYEELPRKNGKTEFAAGIAIVLVVGDGEYGGQVYAMAVAEDQARILFNKAGQMVRMSPTLSKEFELLKPSIYLPALNASIRPISSKPGSKHGFNPIGALADELHEWSDGELYEVIREGMGARRQPLSVLITTAGEARRGFGWEMHERAKKIRDGIIEDPTFLPVIFAADDDDDWTDEAVWAKANPNLGVSPKIEFLRDELQAALESPRKEARFKRYYLNIWTNQAQRWLPMDRWDACSELPFDPKALEGRRCWGALDLSRKVDISAFVLCFPPDDGEEVWTWLVFLWVPEERMAWRARNDQVPYPDWARQGLIKATPGNVVDYRVIRADINELGRRYGIEEIGFDPWNATQLATQLGEEDGFVMVEMRQGNRTLSEPCKFVEGLVLETKLATGGHPVLRWMASNIVVKSDVNENIQPDKAKSTERIDGMTAGIMATGRAMVHVNGEAVIDYAPGEMFA